MSEFHPNRPAALRTPFRLRRKRILEAWPHLIWLAMIGVAWFLHARGVSFVRMNGAVDVKHQFISTTEDGALSRILVQEGDVIGPGTVVAEMESGSLRHQLNAVLLGVAASRREESLALDRIRINLESELRGYRIDLAEGEGRLAPLQKFRGRLEGSRAATITAKPGSLQAFIENPVLPAADRSMLEAEVGEITGRQEALAENVKTVQEELERISGAQGRIAGDAAMAQQAVSGDSSLELLAALSGTERAEVVELKSLIEACLLRSGSGGVVEKVDRSAGDYIRAGESIVQVSTATDRIVGFLPQAHLGRLKNGDRVWISPAHDRNAVYESVVINIAGRVSSLLDASSPLPNQRIFGRHISVRMPTAGDGTEVQLAPGQSVIIQTSRPGSIPLLNRLFPVDPPAI